MHRTADKYSRWADQNKWPHVQKLHRHLTRAHTYAPRGVSQLVYVVPISRIDEAVHSELITCFRANRRCQDDVMNAVRSAKHWFRTLWHNSIHVKGKRGIVRANSYDHNSIFTQYEKWQTRTPFFANDTLPKAQRTRRLSSAHMFRSYHKFLLKSWSIFIVKISTKHQFQNLNQASASRPNFNFKILTKLKFRISTKIKLKNTIGDGGSTVL